MVNILIIFIIVFGVIILAPLSSLLIATVTLLLVLAAGQALKNSMKAVKNARNRLVKLNAHLIFFPLISHEANCRQSKQEFF